LRVNDKNIMIIIGFISYLLIAILIEYKLISLQKETYKVYPYLLLIGFLYVPAGLIIGLLNHKRETKKGKWKFNFGYFLLFCLPSLYIILYGWIHYLPFLSLPEPISTAIFVTRPYSLFGLILGFGIMTSFYKKEKD